MINDFRGHYARMSQSNYVYPKTYSEPYQVVASEESYENDRFLKKAVNKTIDPTKINEGIRVSDFYMENIIAVGALDGLRDCKLSLDNLSASDNVDTQLGSIDSAVVSENNSNDGGNE